MNPFGLINPFMTHKADAQQMKDFRRLESFIVDMCVQKVLKKERNYYVDSEIQLAKCFDTAFVYVRSGLNELNQFAYENNIKT